MARGSGPFSATFTFGRIAAERSEDCAFPNSEPSTDLQFGTIQFLMDGTFNVNGTESLSCAGGGNTSQAFVVSGIYSLASDGDLILDFDPLNPGVEIDHFQMSLDRSVLIARGGVAGEPGLMVAVRQSNGLGDGSLNGEYALGAIAMEIGAAGWTTTGSWGSLSADGLGGFSTLVDERKLGPTGASLTSTGGNGTYSLSSNGTLSMGGNPSGAITADGSFGFFVDWNAPGVSLSCLVRKAGSSPTPGYLHGDWVVTNLGGEQPVANFSTEPWEATGVATVSGGSGAFSFVGTNAWVNLTSGGGGPDIGTGSISMSGNGAITISDGGSYLHDGWTTGNEGIIAFSVINDPTDVGLGLLVRGQEAVATAYCFGDGAGQLCPCNNDNDGSEASGHAGCANGASSGGAVLGSYGTASISANDLVLSAAGLIPNQPGLLFQARNTINGGVGVFFGDGLRCAGGSVNRLAILISTASGLADSTGLSINLLGGVSAGDLRRYQLWFRDPVTSPCGSGFNLSNGVEIAWQP